MEVGHKPYAASRIRFDSFEMDLQSGELRKSGVRVRLQAQPFRVLSVLVEHAGEVVPREELQRRLWGNVTTGDFDHGLNIAVNKIREVLEDSADYPRFIETLSKRGYRFVAAVSAVEEEPEPQEGVVPEPLPETERFVPNDPELRERDMSPVWLVAGAASGVLLLIGLALFLWSARAHSKPTRIHEVTYSGRVYPGLPLQESLAQTATDGRRIYFPQIENGRAVLSQASIADGETSTLPFSSTIVAPVIEDISPDGSKILVRNQLARESEGPLWIVPTMSGAAQQFSNILAHDATWMRDAHGILYATGTDLILANEDGTHRRRLASLPGRAFWLRWAPDGKLLRFTLLNTLDHITSLWEMSSDGKHIHPLLPGWSHPESECCGSWTADGRYFVFQSAHNGLNNIWALDEGTPLGNLFPPTPFEVTNGPLSYQSPITTPTGHQIFFLGLDARSELLQYNPESKLFLPNNNILNSAQFVRFSPDGQWVAWISLRGSTLWRSRTDGTRRLQLTSAPMEVYMMQWSADGRRLVVMGREPGKLWRLYQVNAEDGDLRPLLNEKRNEADPSWSPDGTQIVFGRPPDVMAERSQPKAIYLLDLKTGTFVPLPGSEGLFSPRWSPDGRYIAAIPLGQRKLMLFDFTTKTWKTLVPQPAADPIWSHDGHWIYFHDFLEESQTIYRASVPDGHVERVAGLGNLQSIDIADFRFVGLAPGDLPLIRARMSTANIYSADLDDTVAARVEH
jgi:Tol biopolymer transport system component/DNA-binding winged helix-turn-helix (wHTH) protein